MGLQRSDIDHARIVWARDMALDENQKLIDYFKNRKGLVRGAGCGATSFIGCTAVGVKLPASPDPMRNPGPIKKGVTMQIRGNVTG